MKALFRLWVALILSALLISCGGGGGGGAGGGSPSIDTDGDEVVDSVDTDDDDDGVPDVSDAFPLDPNEWADSDSDGVGDNADSDLAWDTGSWDSKEWK